MAGFAVWLTGLSGSGKTTLARRLELEIKRRGVHVEVLDGDEQRELLCAGLGFSKADRDANIRRIGFVAKLLARAGACVVVAAISPYRAVRDEQRTLIPRFIEVYCRCELETLIKRDPKGLYRRALVGDLQHFTGIDDPYEAPDAPEVVCDTGREDVNHSAARIIEKLIQVSYITG